MSDIKISIIMPVYKVEEYVGKAIESILAQTFTEFEFLIVDDGTPDRSGEICDRYAKKDHRIRVIHKENGGAPSARNTAIDIAQGKYVYFLDSDDWAEPQMLADMLTIREKLGRLKGVKFVYMGDARYNMGNSLMIVCAKLGLHFTACTAKEYFPDKELVAQCEAWAKRSGGSITLTEDVEEGTKGAEVLYTDVWVSMGEPDEVWAERIKALLPYQINKKVMENAAPDAIFMHCLPSFHDLKTKIGKQIHDKFGLDEMEVTDEVFESEQSVVFDEAENRMHTIKAVMAATLGAY